MDGFDYNDIDHPDNELEAFGSNLLQNGSKGSAVRNVQYVLFLEGYLTERQIDGAFGSQTRSALIEYVLLSKSGDSGFRNRFKESAFAIYRRALAGKFDDEQIEYIITYVSSCGLGMIEHWYETGKKYSIDEFMRLVQTLIGTGIMGYLQGAGTRC